MDGLKFLTAVLSNLLYRQFSQAILSRYEDAFLYLYLTELSLSDFFLTCI